MRVLAGAGAMLVLGLAACGDGDERAATETAGTENVQAQIDQLPEGQRNGVFIRAIRDAGEECQHVERSERSGENRGRPVWTAHCEGGGEYAIVIDEGGMAAVVNASEATIVDGDQATNAQ